MKMDWLRQNGVALCALAVAGVGAYTTIVSQQKTLLIAVEGLEKRVDAQGNHIGLLNTRMIESERTGDKAVIAVDNLVKATSELAATTSQLVISVAKLEVQIEKRSKE